MLKNQGSFSHYTVHNIDAVKQEESDLIDIDVKLEYLMDFNREEGYFDDLNEDDGGVGGDDVGGGGVVVKEEVVECCRPLY